MSITVITVMSGPERGGVLPPEPVTGLQPTTNTSQTQAKDVLMRRLLPNEPAEMETAEMRILEERARGYFTPRAHALV
jgi:hypothetical protein